MLELQKKAKRRNRLLGSVSGIFVVCLVAVYFLVSYNASNTTDLRVKSLTNDIVTALVNKQADDTIIENTAYATALDTGGGYARLFHVKWGDRSLSTDDLLKDAKDFGFSSITVYKPLKDEYVGSVSTQPENIGVAVDNSEEGAEILSFLMQVKEGNIPALSKTLNVSNGSISSNLYKYEGKYYSNIYSYIPKKDIIVAIGVPLSSLTNYLTESSMDVVISRLVESNPQIVEMGVLDISESLPEIERGKILSGKYKYSSSGDTRYLTGAHGVEGATYNYIMQVGEKDLYKYFHRLDETKTIYLGLDYTSFKKQQDSPLLLLIILLVVAGGIIFILVRHFKHLDEFNTRVTKRVASISARKYRLKPIEVPDNEDALLVESLNSLLEKSRLRDERLKVQVSELNSILEKLSNNSITDDADRLKLRNDLRTVVSEIKVVLGITE